MRIASIAALLCGAFFLASSAVHAESSADATEDITVKVQVTAGTGVDINYFSLGWNYNDRYGYGEWIAEANGVAAAGDVPLVYTAELYTKAFAAAPPTSYAEVSAKIKPGTIAKITNTTAMAQAIKIEMYGSIFADAFAYGYNAWASNVGGYAIGISGSGIASEIFTDKCETVASTLIGPIRDVCNPSKNPTFSGINLAPGGVITITNQFIVSTSKAFASDVPEASTWAMMLVGFAGAGFVGYRRTKASPAARRAS
jgi:hypothetical protein